ncbi:universal stress protein [Haloterrigena sp. SYSU A121-1]|uniref:Universal stress protein n=1 Tax=Haloterrigena gelatinilytica TaxID=2741724 RepID=A0A8J8GPN7_9EURY|nr:universal stress protein [Haloterrigena gelatinilytica]NUB93676.1 universal stress protein [Haloterrigena gelatinilytica]
MVIVAAVDRSERAPDVLDQAATLADQFGESLHVVHVMTRSEAVDAETTGISKDEGVEISELRAVAAGVVTDLLEEHPVAVKTTETGRIGDPADEIIEYADDRDARYIVVGPRRRSQTGKMLFGSVAQSILLNTNRPVVSVLGE